MYRKWGNCPLLVNKEEKPPLPLLEKRRGVWAVLIKGGFSGKWRLHLYKGVKTT
jgi:hypothetical protein